MRTIARNDDGTHRFIAAQSPTGRALFIHFGLDPDTFETVLLLDDGKAYAKLDAILGIARPMRGVWRAASVLRFLPRSLADRLYDGIAKNRYRLFGRYDTCIVPDAAWRSRVIE